MPTFAPAATLAAPAEPLGAQRPRIRLVPPSRSTSGVEATELAAQAGLILDPWESYALEDTLGERENGTWAAFESGLIVGRQNGKGSILEARELAGLFLFGERLILHSAHQVKTASEAFIRIVTLLENTDHLRKQVKRINKAHGEEGVELRSGQRLRFIARSRVSGRGFTGDCIILDEAFELSDAGMASLFPTLAARPNPQVWYTSSAANWDRHPHSRVLARLRRRALAGDTSRLAFLEWSLGIERDEWDRLKVAEQKAIRRDPASWAATNPGLGIRISEEYIASELGALSAKDFDVERLGIGDWPPEDDDEGWEVISREAWEAIEDVTTTLGDRVAFAIDVTPDRSMASIAVAGRRWDGLLQVEIAANEPGTAWVVPWMVERKKKWRPLAVVVDPGSPAGSLITDLDDAGIELTEPTARQVGQACGQFHDLVTDSKSLRHRGDALLATALAGARERLVGDGAWAWARRGLTVDISPLVAATLALWGFTTKNTPAPVSGGSRDLVGAVANANPWRSNERLNI